MSYLAILAAGIFFVIIAAISLYMFCKGLGRSYLLITLIAIILIYFVFDLWEPMLNSYRAQLFSS